ncbi:VWA-like domain-containing protein [Alkalihalobacillus sp. MEB130]|uniref:VWA-like domain-containing protein n=1 Tax=Alkalihalobacillus sp. MEB130 TaxID=2976704 RepID=UPI0028DEDC18|nr:VWA-like domain-containing protein [Alkalihalobacillus sp. MEB130]MDT8859911.1 VWA-like domain-containing protein [Alkalihalobacillus sp. MEB130]
MKWQKSLLTTLQRHKGEKIALAVDTSTNEVSTELINNIVALFAQLSPETKLVQSDFKIRDISTIDQANITYYKHGKSSYTEVLEWAEEENIDILFYITDVTGYFYDELKVDYDVMWLVPNDFVPKVPFGKTLKIA